MTANQDLSFWLSGLRFHSFRIMFQAMSLCSMGCRRLGQAPLPEDHRAPETVQNITDEGNGPQANSSSSNHTSLNMTLFITSSMAELTPQSNDSSFFSTVEASSGMLNIFLRQ